MTQQVHVPMTVGFQNEPGNSANLKCQSSHFFFFRLLQYGDHQLALTESRIQDYFVPRSDIPECYTFEPNEDIKEAGVYYMSFE